MTARRKIATICLMTAMFLNPLGFDVAFAMIMSVTGSYWITTGIFYLLSLSFFGFYLYLLKINPLKIKLKKIKTK